MSPVKETDIQESSFKQRLVGAMVLIALAVIIVPMVLDFRNNSDRAISGSNIPPKPEDFRVEVLPLHSPDKNPAVANVSDDIQVEIKTISEPSAVLDKEVADPEKLAVPEQPAVVTRQGVIKPDIKVSRPAAVPVPSKSQGVSKIISEVSGPVTWDIQVGSFSSDENALVLRDRLREHGYTAFIDKTFVEGQASFRVRVGPELSKARAEKLRDQLAQEMEMSGIVMTH